MILLFALGGSRDFFFRLFAKGCIMSLHFVWSRPRKSEIEGVGSGEWKAGMVIGSECGRCREDVAG